MDDGDRLVRRIGCLCAVCLLAAAVVGVLAVVAARKSRPGSARQGPSLHEQVGRTYRVTVVDPNWEYAPRPALFTLPVWKPPPEYLAMWAEVKQVMEWHGYDPNEYVLEALPDFSNICGGSMGNGFFIRGNGSTTDPNEYGEQRWQYEGGQGGHDIQSTGGN